MAGLRLVVTGGRNFQDAKAVAEALSAVQRKRGIATLIEGGARGADRLCGEWARRTGVPVETFRARWDEFGKGAGHRRNQQMIDEGKPDAAVAFAGGRGTADMVARLKASGIPVWDLR